MKLLLLLLLLFLLLSLLLEGAGGLSKLVISRVIIRVTPFRALITLLITYLLSPLPLQVLRGCVFGTEQLEQNVTAATVQASLEQTGRLSFMSVLARLMTLQIWSTWNGTWSRSWRPWPRQAVRPGCGLARFDCRQRRKPVGRTLAGQVIE